MYSKSETFLRNWDDLDGVWDRMDKFLVARINEYWSKS